MSAKERMDKPPDKELEPCPTSNEQIPQPDPNVPQSTRLRIPTDKGRDYQIDLLTSNLSKSYSR